METIEMTKAHNIACDLIEKYDGKVLEATAEELNEIRDNLEADQNPLTVLFEAYRMRK